MFGEFGFDPPTNFGAGVQWVRENAGFCRDSQLVEHWPGGAVYYRESGLRFDETVRIPTFRIPIPLPPRGPGLPPHPGTFRVNHWWHSI